MVTVLWTGVNSLDMLEQVKAGVKYYFSSTMSRTLSKFGLPQKPACSFLTVPPSCSFLAISPWIFPCESCYVSILGHILVKRCGSHLFLGWPRVGWWDHLRAGIFKSRNIFILRPILVRFHIRTQLIKSLPTTYGSWRCAEGKLYFIPFHTSRQLKCDKRLFPPFWRYS